MTMRVEKHKDGTYACWMTDREYDQLQRAAHSLDDLVKVRLGADVGLRSHEIAAVKPGDLHRSAVRIESAPRPVDATWLRVPDGKDTRGGGAGKARDAIVPERAERDILMLQNERDIDDDDPLFPSSDPSGGPHLSKRSIQRHIKENVAHSAADETGNEDFLKISSHDLRRYFATTMLQKHGMNPEVVMDVGGWENYEDLKPYLAKPAADVVVKNFHAAGLV